MAFCCDSVHPPRGKEYLRKVVGQYHVQETTESRLIFNLKAGFHAAREADLHHEVSNDLRLAFRLRRCLQNL